jgi:hypothetical protein
VRARRRVPIFLCYGMEEGKEGKEEGARGSGPPLPHRGATERGAEGLSRTMRMGALGFDREEPSQFYSSEIGAGPSDPNRRSQIEP